MGYKYECLTYLDVYQAALTGHRTPKHACLQIVIYIYIYIVQSADMHVSAFNASSVQLGTRLDT
jgi:hypothetical protein